jgi:hypothetical protein
MNSSSALLLLYNKATHHSVSASRDDARAWRFARTIYHSERSI